MGYSRLSTSGKTRVSRLPPGWQGAVFFFALAVNALAQQAATPGGANPSIADLAALDLASLFNVDVTTASRFKDKLSDTPAIMSVVTSDELRRFGGLTLNEILQRVAGLTGTTQYFVDRSMVAALGDQTKTSGGHILFLINGRPTREVMEGGVISDLMESFPVEILDRIEIIKGPGSVLYGSNAFSAVVNLITKKANGNQITAKTSMGTRGAEDESGTFQVRHGDFSGVGAVQRHELADWPTRYLVPPSQQDLSFAPQVPPVENVTLVDKGVGAYAGLNYKGLSFMSSFTEWQSTGFIEGTVSPTRLTREFGNLGYDHRVMPNWDMSFNLTFTRTTFKEVPFPNVTRDSDESIAEWTNLVTLTSKDRLSAGGLINRLEGIESLTGTVPSIATAEGRRLGGAIYAQLDHQLLSNLKLIGGFQTNKSAGVPLSTVPRGGAIWQPSARTSVKALYSQAFRAPSLDENLLNNPGLGGNPLLKPETISTYQLGASFETNKAQIGIDCFHSIYQNDIEDLPGPTRAVYQNLPTIRFNGAELESKYYFRKTLFLQGSMLYQVDADADGSKHVSPVPTIGFKAGLSYDAGRKLTAGVFDVSDGPFTGYTSVNPFPGWHHILNANFRYDVTKYLPFGDRAGIALVAHANNLTNQTIWLPSGLSSVDTVPVNQGRAIFAGLEFSVGNL